MALRALGLFAASALLLSCGDPKPDSDPGEETDTDTDVDSDTDQDSTLDGACPDATRLGRFTAASTPDYAYVTGSALDAVVPMTVYEAVSTEGECTMLVRENPFCDPPCEANETCDFEGRCIPFPTTQDLGIVRVEGLLEPVAMEAVSPGYTYYDTTLPNPPWSPDAPLALRTGGGAFNAVQLYGEAPQALIAPSAAWEIVDGEPLLISWDPPSGEVHSSVRITLNVDLHGVTPALLECWFADDGEGEVPAALLSAFLGLGITGFPEGSFARVTADQAPLGDDGCLDFWTSSSLAPSLSVDGYTPCTRDEDCPDGMECNEELERCE
jgi:hypothetical protein